MRLLYGQHSFCPRHDEFMTFRLDLREGENRKQLAGGLEKKELSFEVLCSLILLT
jgi:hypothetical protein